MLAAKSISKSHGAAVVLDRVSVAVDAGQRVGVVGPNGIGKSTWLRVLAGVEPADSGAVERVPPNLRVGLLPQEPDTRPGETLGGYLARRTGVQAANESLDVWTEKLATDPDATEQYSDALEHFLAIGGADFDARV